MTFMEHMRKRFGAAWVLAPRLTPNLRAKGYRAAVTKTAYRQAQIEWARGREAANPDITAAVRVLRDPHAREAADILARYTAPA